MPFKSKSWLPHQRLPLFDPGFAFLEPANDPELSILFPDQIMLTAPAKHCAVSGISGFVTGFHMAIDIELTQMLMQPGECLSRLLANDQREAKPA